MKDDNKLYNFLSRIATLFIDLLFDNTVEKFVWFNYPVGLIILCPLKVTVTSRM